MSKLSRVTVLKHYLKFRHRCFFSQADLESYQFKKLDFLFKNIFKKSPFYQKFLQPIDRTQCSAKSILETLPILSKKEYLKHFDEINTCNIKYKNALELAQKSERNRTFDASYQDVSVGLSSGTSGTRGLFLVNQNEKTLWTALALARTLHTSILAKHRIALILRANSDLYESTNSKSIQFKYFDLTSSLADLYSGIQKFNPTVLLGPASCLETIAKKEAKLKFNERLHPHQIIACAEILYDDVKHFLENTWHIQIDQIYQATEGFLAFTCQHGALHFNEDCLYIEKEYIPNSENKRYFFPILTDFFRISQPMIRYKLNDILEEDQDQCPCGCPFSTIKRIVGREEDLIHIHRQTLFPNELSDIIENIKRKTHDQITDFQITFNNHTNILTVRLKTNTLIESNSEVKNLIKQEIFSFFEQKKMRQVIIQFDDFLESKPWIKRRRITTVSAFRISEQSLPIV